MYASVVIPFGLLAERLLQRHRSLPSSTGGRYLLRLQQRLLSAVLLGGFKRIACLDQLCHQLASSRPAQGGGKAIRLKNPATPGIPVLFHQQDMDRFGRA